MVMFLTQHNKQSDKHFPLYFKQSHTQPKITVLSSRRKTGPRHKSAADSTSQNYPSYTQKRIGRQFNPLWVISVVMCGLGSIGLVQLKSGSGLMERTSCSLTGQQTLASSWVMTVSSLLHLTGYQIIVVVVSSICVSN